MGEYEQIRDIIEKEIMAIKKSLVDHPKRYSAYGLAYWDGNVACLGWVLTKLAEVHLSTGSAIDE